MKYSIALIFLLTLGLAWYFTQEAPRKEVVSEGHKSTNLTPEKVDEPEEKTAKSNETLTEKIIANQAEEQLPNGQLFHHDPIIDTFTGMIEFSVCNTFFSQDEQTQQQLANLNEKQSQHLLPHFDHCEHKAAHVKSYSQNRLMYQLAQLGQDKALKHKYQSMLFNNSELNVIEAADINQQISQLSGMELLFSSVLYKRYFQQEVIPLVKIELQAHDLNMVEYVLHQAITLIACERGADCTATSPMMYSNCINYEKACGLDFNTYINNHYTPGIRNEIQKTTQFLKNLISFN